MKRDLKPDHKDLQIVDLLQQDAWMTHAKIARAVHLSASAVHRRIERLRERGVIKGARATIDPAKLSRRLRMYLLLELENDSKARLDALTRDLRRFPEVTQVDLVSGKFDVLLTVDCTDAESFAEFAMSALNENPNVRHCWTLTRLKALI